jgi:replication factor A1
LDDGTGALNAVIGKEPTESLLKKSLDECLQETRNSPNPDVIKDRLHKMLVGQPMRLKGNVLKDDFGLMMIVESVEFLKIDLKKEAGEMMSELEGQGGL